jgi:regulator of protease activity HflC (stomatin/prohibitin superfamily)
LTPGKYRLNHFLWKVEFGEVTDIPKGFVGVVKSNVRSRVDFGNLRAGRPEDCSPTADVGTLKGVLSVPLVPVGCIGVWGEALNPGKYYINEKAYTVTLVDTRVQTWEYRGGFTRRQISLAVDQQGRITQREESESIRVPQHAADEAIFLKVEGWTIAQQLRVLVQVTPEHAPFVVASVGGLQEVEDRIMSPAVQSVVRNVAGGMIRVPTQVLDDRGNPILDDNGEPELRTITRRVRVLDVIENRTALEEAIEKIIHNEGLKAGVDIKEVRLLEPDLPPELLVARKREQLAQQLAKAYHQERGAQSERIKTEQTRATADQQDKLVEAQIEVKRSEQFAMARRNEGQGERDKLVLIAEGQKSQSEILGQDRVVELRKFEFVVGRLLDFFDNNPEVLTSALTNAHKFVPERVFTLGGTEGSDSLAGAAGVLGDFLDSGDRGKNGATAQ